LQTQEAEARHDANIRGALLRFLDLTSHLLKPVQRLETKLL
jgi:hypothetical protein